MNICVIVSLADSVAIVKDYFEKYNNNAGYNPEKYLNALVSDIFSNDDVIYYESMSSTKILINDGLDVEMAKRLASDVFISVIDTVSTFIPDIRFNSKYKFELISGIDLRISEQK